MPEHPWRRTLRRRIHRPIQSRGIQPWLLTLLVGTLTAWVAITVLSSRLRPIVRNAAHYQIENRLVTVLEEEITREMTSGECLVQVQRDAEGRILALSTDTAALNLLRAKLVEGVLRALGEVEAMEVEVPLGSLLDTELIWGRGPAIRVRSTILGTVSAEFDSSLSSAGINQTQHRIWLEVSLPVRLFLPGGPADLLVETKLTVAENVIVGEIPDIVLGPGLQSALVS